MIDSEEFKQGESLLPNGCMLYWRINEAGGRTYTTDECAIETEVWDTAVTAESTVLAALTKEHELRYKERIVNERNRRKDS